MCHDWPTMTVTEEYCPQMILTKKKSLLVLSIENTGL